MRHSFAALYRVVAAGGVAAAMWAGSPLAAQTTESASALSVVGGPWQYDLSGTGTSWFAGLRLAVPIGGPLLLEPGITYARYTSQGDDDVNLVFPEAQLQVELLRRRLRPFIGVGAGPALAWTAGASDTDIALTASAGMRAQVSPLWGVLGELRIRSINPWTGSAAEWTVGISRRLAGRSCSSDAQAGKTACD